MPNRRIVLVKVLNFRNINSTVMRAPLMQGLPRMTAGTVEILACWVMGLLPLLGANQIANRRELVGVCGCTQLAATIAPYFFSAT